MTALLRWHEGKDPSDVWDFSLDATDAMAKVGDTLASAAVTVTPTGLTIGTTAVTEAGVATVRLSGGTAGTDYAVTFALTTTGGRLLERSAYLLVRNL